MNQTKLYTVVLDYKGGTYIGQSPGTSPKSAVSHWLSGLSDAELSTWKISRDDLHEIVESDDAVPLTGCQNVWCLTGSTDENLILINVIATAIELA